ncbi:MAG: molybdenum cofactor biosynthesis protein MoaE [Methanomassiliicoccales archaeon]|nr:molybdenum cofactor biosynthesis protein MoaE [Methanomassiliicoccales archaeon]
MITFQTEPLDVASIIAHLKGREAGATAVFVGSVRPAGKAGKVEFLEVECYEPMALDELPHIVDEAKGEHGLVDAAVVHRTGRLRPGEDAVVAAASAAHRKEAFVAVERIVDRMRELAPIWKKEICREGEKWGDRS